MSRPIQKAFFACSAIMSLGVMLTPQIASAGGFGFGGINMASAYGAAFNRPRYVGPPPVYFQPRPIMVEAPPVRHRHREPRPDVAVASRAVEQPAAVEIARTVTPPAATPTVEPTPAFTPAPPPAPRSSLTIDEPASAINAY
jgi:hypothetical protein